MHRHPEYVQHIVFRLCSIGKTTAACAICKPSPVGTVFHVSRGLEVQRFRDITMLIYVAIYFLHATGMRVENASADVPLIPGPGRFASHLKGVRPTWM